MKLYKNSDNEIYAYESDGSQDAYIPKDFIAITDAEAESMRPVPPEPTYKELRAAAYPSLAEQADMAYWDRQNGTTTLDDAITAVKTKYPKGATV